MKEEQKWEEFCKGTEKLRVPGGWLVRDRNNTYGTSMVFVKDPYWVWDVGQGREK